MLCNSAAIPYHYGGRLSRQGCNSPPLGRIGRHVGRPAKLQLLQPHYRLQDAFPGVIDTDLPTKRSVRPIMVEQFNVDWEKVFSFLFPDGNILHGSWTSYAIIAFVLAVLIELGTQLLYLLVRGRELISPRRAEALARRQAIGSMKSQRKEQMEERARQLAVEQRAQQVRAQRKQQQRSGELERTGEDDLEQELTDKRYIFQDYIAGERLRGLAWLLTWTVLAIWITGILNKESPLAP